MNKTMKHYYLTLLMMSGGLQAMESMPGNLFEAMRTHNVQAVERLIAQGVNVNQTDFFGDTPLIRATRGDDYEIAQILLSAGANPNIKNGEALSNVISGTFAMDVNGMSRLDFAMRLIDKMVTTGGDISTIRRQINEIRWAQDREALLRHLSNISQNQSEPTEKKEPIAINKPEKLTPEELAAAEELREIRLFYKEYARQKDLKSKLFQAADYLDMNQIKELIAQGLDINVQSRTKGTVLIRAIHAFCNLRLREDIDIIFQLIELGANPNLRNSFGLSPLYVAIECKLPLITQALIHAGADLDSRDEHDYGRTALIQATRLRQSVRATDPLIRILIDSGADSLIWDYDGNTALFYAVTNGFPIETSQRLISAMYAPSAQQLKQARARSVALIHGLRTTKRVLKGVDQQIARALFDAYLQEARAGNAKLITKQIARIRNPDLQKTLLDYFNTLLLEQALKTEQPAPTPAPEPMHQPRPMLNVDLQANPEVSPRRVLGVAPDATQKDIVKAYRNASRLFHPDHFEENRADLAVYGIVTQHKAQEAMAKINAAYNILK